MNPQKALGAELLAAVSIAAVGAGKFPPPHRFTGVFLLWFILGLAAQAGRQAARFSVALGGLVVLTLAMGQAGKRVIGWLAGVGPRLGVEQPPAPGSLGAESSGGTLADVIAAAKRLGQPAPSSSSSSRPVSAPRPRRR